MAGVVGGVASAAGLKEASAARLCTLQSRHKEKRPGTDERSTCFESFMWLFKLFVRLAYHVGMHVCIYVIICHAYESAS